MSVLVFLTLFLLVSLKSFAHPVLSPRVDIIPCNWLWASWPFFCTTYTENQAIGSGGASVTLNVYAFGNVTIDSQYLPDAVEAAQKSMALYGDFLNGESLNIKVYIGDVFTDGAHGAYARTGFDGTCQVQIVTQISDVPVDEVAFMQTMAHELYHCIQRRLGQVAGPDRASAAVDIAKWWKEGTAEYFGNSLYPHGVRDWITNYPPTVPLYSLRAIDKSVEGDDNTAWLYFQHLAANLNWSPRQIHDFMASQTFVDSLGEELYRLSLQGDFTATFTSFATSFLDNQIPDADGSLIQLSRVGDIVAKEFTVPITPPGSTYDLHVTVTPWNIDKLAKTSFEFGKIVTVAFTVAEPNDDRTVVQYRKTGDTEWQLLSKGETADLQSAAPSECGFNEYVFLITTTFDPSRSASNDNPLDAGGSVDTPDDLSAQAILSFTVIDPPTKRDDSCDKDTCLVGDWSLDIPSMQAYLTELLAAAPDSGSGATITNLVVSGSSSFSVTSAFSSTMNVDNLVIAYDGAAQGFTFHTEIDLNGSVHGDIVPVTAGSTSSKAFTWKNSLSTGMIHSITTLSITNTPLPLDFPMDGQYGSQTTVEYECHEKSLHMAGYVGGKYVWGYT